MNDRRILIIGLLIIAFILSALLILHNDRSINRININTATKEELTELPYIEDILAARIISGRPYEKLEDIMKVEGIGETIYQNIMDKVVIK